MDPPKPDSAPARGAPVSPRRSGEFDAFYEGRPPWDIGRPQPAFLALANSGALRGRVLDAGCGTGEHTLLAASLGLDAMGVDSSPKAIALAEQKARDRGLRVRFLPHDALDLAALGEKFDTVLDSGLFHVFDDADRAAYVASLTAVVPPGGHYFMLCFSDRMPGEMGPRRVTQAEIRACFSEGWSVDSIDPVTLESIAVPVEAWLARVTRK